MDRFITKLFWEPQNVFYLAIETKLVPYEFRTAPDDSLPSSDTLEDASDNPGGPDTERTSGGSGSARQAEKIRKAVMRISSTCDQVVTTFFIDAQKCYLIHEQREFESGGGSVIGDEHLVGIEVPYLYFTRNCGQSRLAKKPTLGRIKELEQTGVK